MPKYGIYYKKLAYEQDKFFHQYEVIAKDYKEHVLLESGRGGTYSVAAFGPAAVLTGKDRELTVRDQHGTTKHYGNLLAEMKKWMEAYQVETADELLPDFRGGAIGFISYDYARSIEKLPQVGADDLAMPEVHFFVFDQWFVFDHVTKELWIMLLAEEGQEEASEQKAEEWLKRWTGTGKSGHLSRKVTAGEEMEVSMDETQFIDAVHKIQHYISQGDVFQVNLSVRQTRPLGADPLDVYRKLREFNPSPYMGYYHTEEFQLVCGSPELLVKKKGRKVSTRPIAGTRSRGRDELEDARLAAELIHNEKERAEHVMLVDLERNDLGRVCQYGSVEVDEFMVIEKYSHVMHIVSNVKGELLPESDWDDVIHAVFPGGTITGAPKVRTMEIIEELEPVRRGPYTGSLGWVGFNGDMDMNIIIRTMLAKEGKAHIQAGAGIVIDSNPQNEYKESLKKAFALWRAKELAESEKGENT
jgi:para-aminobenzoate synthetase component I